MDFTIVWSTMFISREFVSEGCWFLFSGSFTLVPVVVGPCALLANGHEFSQWPCRWGRQFKHSLPAFLQEQFLHRPLALHRQHATGMPQHSKTYGSQTESQSYHMFALLPCPGLLSSQRCLLLVETPTQSGSGSPW